MINSDFYICRNLFLVLIKGEMYKEVHFLKKQMMEMVLELKGMKKDRKRRREEEKPEKMHWIISKLCQIMSEDLSQKRLWSNRL